MNNDKKTSDDVAKITPAASPSVATDTKPTLSAVVPEAAPTPASPTAATDAKPAK